MAQGLIVRLADGSEIGPLGRDDLRSWFEGGLISADSMVKRPDAARWTTLGQEVDVTLWRQLAGGTRTAAPGARRGAPARAAGARPAPSPRPRGAAEPVARPAGRSEARASWELPGWVKLAALAVVLVALAGGTWRYFTNETEAQKKLRAAAAPERRFADADAGVALDLPAGWIIVRPDESGIAAPAQARVLVAEPSSMTVGYLMSEAPARPYTSLDEYLGRVAGDRRRSQVGYQEGTRSDGSVGPFPARLVTASWKSGDDAFSERITAWKEAWTYFALVTWTPQARQSRGARATEALARGFSSVGQVGQRVQQALQRVITEVPHLSTRSAETLMGRSAAGVLEPPEVFRRSWDLASRGLFTLDKAEARELSSLTSAVYARVPGSQRARLGAYVARVRERETTSTEQDAEMCAVMKAAVDKLSPLHRERLQELFDKAIAAGLTRAS
jgi:hypothetical protein